MIKRRFGVSFQELEIVLRMHGANFGATQLTLVRPQGPTRIDLSNNCPCLCRQQDPLFPIVLTKFFGCDWCQPIFVFEENRQIIEQLPYKLSWRWTERFCWLGMLSNSGGDSLRITLRMIVVSIGLPWLALRLPASLSMVIWIVLMGLLITLSAIIFFVSLSALMQTLWQ